MRTVSLPALLEVVVSSARAAGDLLIAEWDRPGGIRGAGDKADIDVEIETLLRESLLRILPCDFWGEETGFSMTNHPWCWVVDPHDGTSDFLKGVKGSAISIGLLHESVPVLGVVYAPVTDDRGMDCIAWAEGLPCLLRNGCPVAVDLSASQLATNAIVMVSAAAVTKPTINAELCYPAQFHAMPSIAYRLARVAAGDGVCAVSIFPVSAHDVVAGHALLKASKGQLVNESGNIIKYEGKMSAVSKRCFGGAPTVCSVLLHRNWAQLAPK